jgi:hypothetical protein
MAKARHIFIFLNIKWRATRSPPRSPRGGTGRRRGARTPDARGGEPASAPTRQTRGYAHRPKAQTPHVHLTASTRASLRPSPRLGLARDDARDACVPGAPCYAPLARPAASRAASPHRRPRRGRAVALVHACMHACSPRPLGSVLPVPAGRSPRRRRWACSHPSPRPSVPRRAPPAHASYDDRKRPASTDEPVLEG